MPGEIKPNVESWNAVLRQDARRRSGATAATMRFGAPCGTTRTFSSGQAPHSTSSRRAVSVITITSSASVQSSVRTARLMRGRLREHRVQRHDERLGELAGEREHVLAVGAAEDPVLVLEQHDVDVHPAEHPRGAHVVAANGLRDRREQSAPLRARRLVHDRDELDALDARLRP